MVSFFEENWFGYGFLLLLLFSSYWLWRKKDGNGGLEMTRLVNIEDWEHLGLDKREEGRWL